MKSIYSSAVLLVRGESWIKKVPAHQERWLRLPRAQRRYGAATAFRNPALKCGSSMREHWAAVQAGRGVIDIRDED